MVAKLFDLEVGKFDEAVELEQNMGAEPGKALRWRRKKQKAARDADPNNQRGQPCRDRAKLAVPEPRRNLHRAHGPHTTIGPPRPEATTVQKPRPRPGFGSTYPVVEPEPYRCARRELREFLPSSTTCFSRRRSRRSRADERQGREFVRRATKELMWTAWSRNGEEKPSLIIFDLNHNSVKPLTLIPKPSRPSFEEGNVDHRLSSARAGGPGKQKAHEVGCDMVISARSAFSTEPAATAASRHGAPWKKKVPPFSSRAGFGCLANEHLHQYAQKPRERPWK